MNRFVVIRGNVLSTAFGALLTLLTLYQPALLAQALLSSVSRDSIRLGERLEVRYELSFPKGGRVIPPAVQAICRNPFEPLSAPVLDTLSKTSPSVLVYTLSITSFDSGTYTIPSAPFQIYQESDTLIFWTDSFNVRVLTVPVDTTQAFRDIKGPLAPPFDWRDTLPYLIGVAIAFLLVFALFTLWRRIRRKRADPVTDTILTPAEKALQALQQIRREKLWQTAEDKVFYTRLTDVLRLFFEEQFGFKAPEMVSSEIMAALRLQGVASDWLRRLEEVFKASDMAKFAKGKPSETEKEGALQTAEEYIRLIMTNPSPS
jgi:hypothetical protein